MRMTQLFDASGNLVATVNVSDGGIVMAISWAGRLFVFNGGRYVETTPVIATEVKG